MSKKILSCVLCAIILSVSLVLPVQAKSLFPYDSLIFGEDDMEQGESEEVAEEFDYEREIKTIVGLGWMSELEVYKYNPKDLVTEYDVYETLINMLEGTDSDKNINVSSDNVTFEYLADIFINNLALDPEVDKDMSFYTAAAMVGLFDGMKGISENAYVNREQLAKVVYNSLNLMQYEIQIGHSKITYNEVGTVSENIDVEIMEGVVTANEYIDFYSNQPLDKEFVAINNLKVKKGNSGADVLLGKHVTAYIKNIEDDPVLLFAYEEDKKTDIKIVTEDYITSNSSVLQYYEGNKVKRVQLNSNARVLYNGRYLGQLSAVDISSYTNNAGYIQTIDTTDDEKADIILITVYETWFVESANISQYNFTITDSLSGDSLKYDNDKTFYFIKNGEVTDAASVEADTVLYVCESLGTQNKLYMVYISDKKYEGIIESVRVGEEVTVDNKTFELDKNFEQKVELKSAVLYLGYDGKVAHIEYKKAGDMQYGYIMTLNCDTEGNDYGMLIAKLYTLDGKAEKYTSAEKIVFENGKAVASVGSAINVQRELKTAKEVYDILDAQGKNQVVQFALNGDGKISRIATAVDSTQTGHIYENAFSRDYYGKVRFYNLYMGSRFNRSTSMKYIQVPTAADQKSDERYYSVKAVSGDSNMDNVEFYDASANGNMQNGFVVIYAADSSAALRSSCSAGVVTNVSIVYDEEECESKNQITITNRDGEVEKVTVKNEDALLINAGFRAEYADVPATELKNGDVILYEKSELGELNAFSLELRASGNTDTYYERVSSGDTLNQTSNFSSLFCSYTEVVGTEISDAGNTVFSTNTRADRDPLWNRCYTSKKDKKVLIYDSQTKTVTSGTGKDILRGEKIFIQSNYYYIRQTYIVIR